MNLLIVLLLLPYYTINASDELNGAVVEDTTDTVPEIYDPEEPFDPQKDYVNFKHSYEKLYRMSAPPLPQSVQRKNFALQQAIEEIEEIESETIPTNHDDEDEVFDENDSILSTTVSPQSEQLTTMKFVLETAPRYMNEFSRNTPKPEINAPNAELLLSKSTGSAYETLNNNDSENQELFGYSSKLEDGVQQRVASFSFAPNESNNEESNVDYVNDNGYDNNQEVNFSQPITSSYSLDTTIASLPSSPIFISTRPPTLLTTNPLSSASATTTFTSSTTTSIASTATK